MPGFCTEKWGRCPKGAQHECFGIIVVTMQRVKPHKHVCDKCGDVRGETSLAAALPGKLLIGILKMLIISAE